MDHDLPTIKFEIRNAMANTANVTGLRAGAASEHLVDDIYDGVKRFIPTSPTLAHIIAMSNSRGQRWTGDDWTKSDYAVATAGEAGEIAGALIDYLLVARSVGEFENAIKKLRRIEIGAVQGNEEGRKLLTEEAALKKIGRELADTFLYMPQLAKKLGIDLELEIVNAFNEKSEECGFPERI